MVVLIIFVLVKKGNEVLKIREENVELFGLIFL